MSFTLVNHRFNGQDHPFTQTKTFPWHAIMWYKWIFMHRGANTVTNQITNNTVTTTFSVFLDSCTDITDTVTDYRLFNTKVHSLTCYFHKFFNFVRWRSNRISPT